MKNQIIMPRLFRLNLLLLITAFAISLQVVGKDAEKSKKITKSFKVAENQILEIENQFGKVDISSWDKMEVQVEIIILVDQRNEQKAQEVLDEIQIDFKESATLLKMTTSLGKEDKDIKMDGKNKFEINYTVKMPESMVLDLENKFGDITIDKLSGRTEIEVQFGSAKIGTLKNTLNELTFKFSDPVIIDEIGGGEIELKFSKLDLGKSGSVELESQMSNSKIGEITAGDMKVNYGSIEIESQGSLTLKSSMSTVKIGELIEGGELDVQYGKLTIDKLSKSFKGLTIDSKFTPIVINVEAGSAFELDANTKMSNLELPSGYVAKDASQYVNNEYFKGVIGEKSGSLPVMKISNQFGKVEIN